MSGFVRRLATAAVAASLCMAPTAAIANAPAAPVAASPAPITAAPTNPWLTLSAMTTSSSAATAAAAAQGDREPGFPPIAPLLVILATIGVDIYILLSDDKDDLDFEFPISPA